MNKQATSGAVKRGKPKEFKFTEQEVKEIKNHFSRVICKGKDRFDKQMLKDHLETCYDQKLGFTICRLLNDPVWFDFRNTTNIKDTDYIINLLKFINSDQTQHRKFVFECYDCFKNNDKITEENLFCFMQIFERFYEKYESTICYRSGANLEQKFISEFKKVEIKEKPIPTELLPLGRVDQDRFINLFNSEFQKITEVLVAKRKKRLAKKAESKQQQRLQKTSARGGSQLGHTSGSQMMAKARQSTDSLSTSVAPGGQPSKDAPSSEITLSKMAEKIKKEEEDFLGFQEFCQIDFGFQPEERFTIINDVLENLTGLKFLPRIPKPQIRNLSLFLAGVQFAHRSNTDEELIQIRHAVKHEQIWRRMCRSFERLWG